MSQRVRSMMVTVDDMMTVAEEPLAVHQFNPTPSFYTFVIFLNIALVFLGTFFVPLSALGVTGLVVSSLFLYTRLYAGYHIRPAMVWAALGLATFAAVFDCLTAYFSAVNSANASARHGAYVACYVLTFLGAVPYLFVSTCLFARLRRLVQQQQQPAHADLSVISLPADDANDAAAVPAAQPLADGTAGPDSKGPYPVDGTAVLPNNGDDSVVVYPTA